MERHLNDVAAYRYSHGFPAPGPACAEYTLCSSEFIDTIPEREL